MTHPTDLHKGNCYFLCNYHDENLFIPEIYTLIFIDYIENRDEDAYWLFQTAESYYSESDPEYYSIKEDQLYSILELIDLRNILRGLEHIHPLNGKPSKVDNGFTEKHRNQIKNHLTRYLNQTRDFYSITITIKYRDKGLSIGCEDGKATLTLFIDFREVPQQEHVIRRIFKEIKIEPKTDYLSQYDRVRVLTYEIVKDTEIIMNIVEKIFLNAYGIKPFDQLRAHYHRRSKEKEI